MYDIDLMVTPLSSTKRSVRWRKKRPAAWMVPPAEFSAMTCENVRLARLGGSQVGETCDECLAKECLELEMKM
jgi:hypothetical protein